MRNAADAACKTLSKVSLHTFLEGLGRILLTERNLGPAFQLKV